MARNPVTRRLFRLNRLALTLAAGFASGALQALPTGGVVVNGTAGMSQTGQTLTVTNSNGTIINWQSFSIGSGETTIFVQPSVTSSVLNRVVTSDPSVILGQLQSNGQVFLVNPAGILVGPGARIDVGAFVASSLQISDADFLARRFNFLATPGAGVVRNEGAIQTPNGGSVYLVGPTVENAGLIAAPGGEVLLAAGRSVQIVDTATPGVQVEVTGSDTLATNMGTVLADAGRIGVVGALVKNSGTLSASSAVAEGGRIFLRATGSVEQTASGRSEANGTQGGTVTMEADDTVLADGQISATGSTGSGGQVRLLADQVGLVGNATVDASGAAGGGTVLVGGDYQGSNPDIHNAKVTWFGAGASIKADATGKGNGGKVIIWADDTTRAYGRISARGGANGGNGGFVEVSGKNYLDFLAFADLRSPKGLAGTLLLDPTDVTIVSSGAPAGGSFSGGIFDGGGASASTIGWDSLQTQLGFGNVVVSTASAGGTGSGNITIDGSPMTGLVSGSAVISHTGADGGVWSNDYSNFDYKSSNSLSFVADGDIRVNSSFANSGTGTIRMVAGWDGVSSLAAPTVTAGTGSIIINYGGGSVLVANVGGAIDLKAGDTVRLLGGSAIGGTNKVAGIDMGSGALTVTANNIEVVAGAAITPYADVDNSAFIQSNGNQTFNVLNGGHLWVKGGGYAGDTGDFGNSARISAHGSGSQTFNISAGGQVLVVGGNGDGADYSGSSGCPTTGSPACSNNQAEIRVEGSGNQTIAFAGGGSLQVIGGNSSSSRGNNSAGIGAETGTQSITGNAAITVTSAGAGGFFMGGEDFGNEAGIFAENGAQNIAGSSLTLDASGTSGIGGAFVVGKNQNINIAGNISLSGGTSNLVSEHGLASGAVIGHESAASINITAGGAFNMNSGSGIHGGTYVGSVGGGANIAITAQGIALNGSAAATAGVGAKDGSPASIVLTANGSGGTNLGSNSQLLAGGGNITINHTVTGGVSVTQATNSQIVANSLTVNGKVGISLTGSNNLVGTVSLETVNGNISYTSNANMVHVTKAKVTGSGDVTLTTGSLGNAIALDKVSVSSTNTANISAKGFILDDNGDGIANITAGTINLSTVSGGHPGGIAVSADVDASGGTVNVTVPFASGDGGIRIRSVGVSAPTTVNLSDATATGLGNVFFAHDGNLVTTANYSIASNSGSAAVKAAGDLVYNGGTISGPLGVALAAGGNLSIQANFTPTSDMGLFADNAITISGTASNLGSGNAYVKAPTVTVGSGGMLKSNFIDLGATTLNVDGLIEGEQGADVIAGQININGGTLKSTLGDVVVDVDGDIKMTGGLISAGNDVSIAFLGAASTFYLNEIAGLPDATVVAGTSLPSGRVILDFLGRSEGGVVIDGLPSFVTSGGSGFYNSATPAVLGTGLIVNYGVTELINVLVNDLLAGTNGSTSSASSPPASGDATDTGTTSVIATTTSFADTGSSLTTTGTSAGTEEFGGGVATTTSGGAAAANSEPTASGNGNDSKSSSKDDGKNGQGKNKRRGMCTA